MEERKKRIRKTKDQLLESAVTNLYEQIEKIIQGIENEQFALEQVFETLRPLHELEKKYHERNTTTHPEPGDQD